MAQKLLPSYLNQIMNVKNNSEHYIDQASQLRHFKPKKHTFTIAIISGKGGVGKSNIAVALSCALAEFGKNVTLVDADLGMANLDILCGLKSKYNIAHLLNGTKSLNDILLPVPRSDKALSNNGAVLLLPGATGLRSIAQLGDNNPELFLNSLYELEAVSDYLILDSGAGIHNSSLDIAVYSDITILITTPEPTSIRDAYGVIKSLAPNFKNNLLLLVNLATSRKQAHSTADRIRIASTKFLGISPVYLGYVLKDIAVEKSVNSCRIFYLIYPSTPASQCIKNISVELLNLCEGVKYNYTSHNSFFKSLSLLFRSIPNLLT